MTYHTGKPKAEDGMAVPREMAVSMTFGNFIVT